MKKSTSFYGKHNENETRTRLIFFYYYYFRFWFLIVAALTILALIYSMVILMMPTTREAVLRRRLREPPNGIERLIRRIQIGDFLILHLLGQNVNVKSYSEILSSLFHNLCGDGDTPSAPSTLEMAPIYPEITKYGKESET